MNMLLLGGCHTGNYGIQNHLGFARQWATHLEVETHEPVQLQRLCMVKLTHLDSLLGQYRTAFQQADRIVLQLGHYELSWRRPFRELFGPNAPGLTTPSIYKPGAMARKPAESFYQAACRPRYLPWRELAKTTVLQACSLLGYEVPYLQLFRQQVAAAFHRLAPYRHKISVLTPFPTLNPLDHWLRAQCHDYVIACAMAESFVVADTFAAIPRHPAYFLADGVHLNSLGHTVLGLFLSELSWAETPLPAPGRPVWAEPAFDRAYAGPAPAAFPFFSKTAGPAGAL
jgi:hypothetical protein